MYTPYYCEENAYLLAEQMLKADKKADIVQTYIIMVTNPFQETYLRYQKNQQNGLVVWDYHVIVVQKLTNKLENKITSESLVYDYDTTLGMPISFDDYFSKAIDFAKPSPTLKTLFKVCDAQSFINNFSSDRHHMMENKKYLQPPPKYAPLRGPNSQTVHELDNYLDTSSNVNGKWMNEAEFKGFFSRRSV